MALKQITQPGSEPITLAEAKAQCRVDADLTADDALLTAQIVAAREHCENILQRALISQQWEKTLDYFPGSAMTDGYDGRYSAAWPNVPAVVSSIPLAFPPLIAVNSITYVDTAGMLQTLDPACYLVDDRTLPGWVSPAWGYVWPTTQPIPNAVRILFTVGYGTDATTVPAAVKAWIKLAVARMYRDREPSVHSRFVTEIEALDHIIDRYRVPVLA
jgi:uncharacterized phiE125 gp8 family phage protein